MGLQRLQFDILKPARAAVVLHANVPALGVIFISDVELVFSTVRTFVRLGELIQVRAYYLFTIEDDFNPTSVAGDLNMVPCTDRLHRLPGWLNEVVECAGIVVTRPGRVVDGNLDAIEPHVLSRPGGEGRSAHEDAAVATLADLKIEREEKVFPLLRVHEHVVAGFMGVKAAFLDRRARRSAITVHPARGALAVEQQQPTCATLGPGEGVVRRRDVFPGVDGKLSDQNCDLSGNQN